MIGFLVAGFVIGAVARLVRPGREKPDLLATIVLGIVGSLCGGLIARSLGTGGLFELNVVGLVLAVVGAGLFIGVASAWRSRSAPLDA